jgi:hypothetical protein
MGKTAAPLYGLEIMCVDKKGRLERTKNFSMTQRNSAPL